MILTDKTIRELCLGPCRMVEPFSETVGEGGVISYGLCSAGYDLRLAPEVFLFKSSYGEILDPKKFKDKDYVRRVFEELDTGDGTVVVPPNSYVLARSFEYLRIPRHLKARCTGKSTYARVGVLVNTTPLEPGWHGHLTVEIGNVTPCPVRLYVGEGVCQVEFEELGGLPEYDYTQKSGGGKYQGQTGVTPARVQ